MALTDTAKRSYIGASPLSLFITKGDRSREWIGKSTSIPNLSRIYLANNQKKEKEKNEREDEKKQEEKREDDTGHIGSVLDAPQEWAEDSKYQISSTLACEPCTRGSTCIKKSERKVKKV